MIAAMRRWPLFLMMMALAVLRSRPGAAASAEDTDAVAISEALRVAPGPQGAFRWPY